LTLIPLGSIPPAHDLVVYEKGGEALDGFTLYGFDEVGIFEGNLLVPQYCFMSSDHDISGYVKKEQ
tara:strand:+ start:12833 stop:13030 length:198 start_codon:yes stop_codon:yes gene_type:complete